MLGLIKKDLFMIKDSIKFLIIILLIYSILAYQNKIDLSFLLPFISVVLMMTTFNYDSYNKWDAYVTTLPMGRKNSVKAKYLATLFIIAISTIIITILSFAIDYFQTNTIDYKTILTTMFLCFFSTSIIESFMYPVIYKFGIEKARIGIFIVVFSIAFIGEFATKHLNFSSFNKIYVFLNNYWIVILPILLILILYISYKISEKIYLKKEF